MASSRIIPADTRRSLNATDPCWKLKFVLHILTLLASLLAISLFASSIPLWNANFFHSRGPNRGDWTDGIIIGPLAFTFVVTVAAFAHTLNRKHSYPPKAAIAIATLILLSLAPTLILAGYGSLFKHWQPPAMRSQSDVLKCNLTNIFTPDCEPILYRVGTLQIGGIVFGTITWLLVLNTFLVSLYEHRTAQVAERQKSRSRGLKRLTLMTGTQRRYKDVEKEAAWQGSGRSHDHGSIGHEKSNQKPHGQRHTERQDHQRRGTKKHYRPGPEDRNDDLVPFVYVKEPEIAHPRPDIRYM